MDISSRMDADGLGDAANEGTQRGLFGRIGSRIGTGRAADARPPREALLLLRNYEESGQGWFWSTDVDGRLTYISEAVAQLMGRGGLLGTRAEERRGGKAGVGTGEARVSPA